VRFKYRVEYFLARIIFLVIQLLPHRSLDTIAQVIGSLIFSLIRIRREVCIANLKSALTDKSNSEIISIGRKSYGHFALVALKFCKLPKDYNNFKKMVSIENEHLLKKGYERGKGVLLVAAHYGIWEYIPTAISRYGYTISVVAKKQKNPYVDVMINNIRKQYGIGIIEKKSAVKDVIRALKNKEGVGIMADQDGGKSGYYLDFFDKPASIVEGPAVIGIKTGSTMLMCLPVGFKNGMYSIKIEEFKCFNSAGGAKPLKKDIIKEYTMYIEQYIRENPAQWLWVHRRWKSKQRL